MSVCACLTAAVVTHRNHPRKESWTLRRVVRGDESGGCCRLGGGRAVLGSSWLSRGWRRRKRLWLWVCPEVVGTGLWSIASSRRASTWTFVQVQARPWRCLARLPPSPINPILQTRRPISTFTHSQHGSGGRHVRSFAGRRGLAQTAPCVGPAALVQQACFD